MPVDEVRLGEVLLIDVLAYCHITAQAARRVRQGKQALTVIRHFSKHGFVSTFLVLVIIEPEPLLDIAVSDFLLFCEYGRVNPRQIIPGLQKLSGGRVQHRFLEIDIIQLALVAKKHGYLHLFIKSLYCLAIIKRLILIEQFTVDPVLSFRRDST